MYAICLILLVKEQWRRQGHGETLLKAAIEKCRTRKVSRIMLHVDPLRTPALNLYMKHGFQVDTLIEGYYSKDRNAFRMYLDFDSWWRRSWRSIYMHFHAQFKEQNCSSVCNVRGLVKVKQYRISDNTHPTSYFLSIIPNGNTLSCWMSVENFGIIVFLFFISSNSS